MIEIKEKDKIDTLSEDDFFEVYSKLSHEVHTALLCGLLISNRVSTNPYFNETIERILPSANLRCHESYIKDSMTALKSLCSNEIYTFIKNEVLNHIDLSESKDKIIKCGMDRLKNIITKQIVFIGGYRV